MRKLVATLSLVLALTTGAMAQTTIAGVELPGETFSGIVQYATRATLDACPADNAQGYSEIAIVLLSKDGTDHRYFWSPETRNLLWLVYPNSQDLPAAVGLGRTSEQDHDTIPAMEWVTFEEAKARYGHPCVYLMGKIV